MRACVLSAPKINATGTDFCKIKCDRGFHGNCDWADRLPKMRQRVAPPPVRNAVLPGLFIVDGKFFGISSSSTRLCGTYVLLLEVNRALCDGAAGVLAARGTFPNPAEIVPLSADSNIIKATRHQGPRRRALHDRAFPLYLPQDKELRVF